MPLEAYEIYITPGFSTTVTCKETIVEFLVGLSRIDLSFDGLSHHEVHRMGIHLQTRQSSSQEIEITAHCDLVGGSGQGNDKNDVIVVVVLAWTGFPNSELQLTNVTNIAAGTSSPPIDVPGGNPAINQPLLSGFDLEYSGHHKIKRVNASVGSLFSGDAAFITAEAGMASGSVEASETSIDGGLIFSSLEDPGFEVTNTGGMRDGSSLSLQPKNSFTHFLPILTSFDIFFDNSAHEIAVFIVDVRGEIDEQNPNAVRLEAGILLSNMDDHENSSDSSLTAALITWSEPGGDTRRPIKSNFPSRRNLPLRFQRSIAATEDR